MRRPDPGNAVGGNEEKKRAAGAPEKNCMRKMLKKINLLLDRRQKIRMVGLVLIMLIGAILETMGIAMIVPVMKAVVDPEAISANKYHMGDIYRLFRMTSSTQMVVFLMGAIIVIFVLKDIFLFLSNKLLLNFIYTNQFETSNRMMINFMMRPYEYYLNADTSIIQRNITSDINNVYALILTLLQMTSELIVFVFLVAVLLAINPKMTLIISAVLIVTLLVIRYLIKPIMLKAGKDNQDYYSGLYKWIDQSVMGIKEIKVANKESYFINEYAKCGAGYVSAVQRYNLFNSTPRLLIETVCIATLVLYMIAEILGGQTQLSDMVSQVSVMVVAAGRLLPSANRINNYTTSIAYFQPFLDNVSENLQSEIHDSSISYNAADYQKKTEVTKLPVTKAIEMRDITYRYPDSDILIFNRANVTFPVGKSIGIVGTSGAGKTTIIDIMLGLLKPESGEVLADGVDIRQNYRGWLKNIGYIPQTIFMLDTTIRRNVAFGYVDEDIDDEKVWAALREAQLDEHVRSLPDGLDTEIGERGIRLSGGQRQRIGIARALFEDPEVLVLDEATSALDGETEAAIMDSINRLHGRKTLIIIAHRLTTIEKCDLVFRVKDEKVVLEREMPSKS